MPSMEGEEYGVGTDSAVDAIAMDWTTEDGAEVRVVDGKGDDNRRGSSRDEEKGLPGDDVEGGGGGEGGGGTDAPDGDENTDGTVDDAVVKMHCCCPRWEFSLKEYCQEVKIILKLAWPNVVYMLLEAMMTIMAVLFSGHLGKNELAAASLANSITTVFTRSIGLGFSSSCDTLFTQFYGSRNRGQIGVVLQRGFLIMFLLCFICWGILINAETILLLAQQSSEVARLAGIYCMIYIPAVPADYFSMLLIKYLQCQSRLMPVVITTAITNVIAIALYYVLIYPLELGLVGAAIAQVMSHYILTILVTIYIFWRKLFKDTWTGWSRECLEDWTPIVKLGFAGCLMVCLEWWSFDIGFYLAGLFGEEAIGAHAIIMYTATTGYMFPYGIGIAAAIRIGNSLGARKPQVAHVASVASLSLGVIAAAILAIVYVGLKGVIPYIFTSDSTTAAIATRVLPVCAMFAVLDATATVCGGVIRGTGRQAIGAVANILGYYLIGLPLGISLMFLVYKGIYGFWSGMTLGLFVASLFLFVFTLRINWMQETNEAQKRVGLRRDSRGDSTKKRPLEPTIVDAKPGEMENLYTEVSTEFSGGVGTKEDEANSSDLQRTSKQTQASDEIIDAEAGDSPDSPYVALHSFSHDHSGMELLPEANASMNNSTVNSTGNGYVKGSAVRKVPEAAKKLSLCYMARTFLLFLWLGVLFVALAVICRALVVPPLREGAMNREMMMANLTNSSVTLLPTEAVQYEEVQTLL